MSDAHNGSPLKTLEGLHSRVSLLEAARGSDEDKMHELESKVIDSKRFEGDFIAQQAKHERMIAAHHREIQRMVFDATGRWEQVDRRMSKFSDDMRVVIRVVKAIAKKVGV